MNLLFLHRHNWSQIFWCKVVKKKSYKNTDIYYIGYITIKKIDDYESIYSVNPLYLCINHASGYIKEKNGNKYLSFDSVDENEEELKNTQMFGSRIKSKIRAINGRKENNYEKDYMKIKFDSDDDLLLNNQLKFHLMTILIRCVFTKDDKFYP